MKTLKPIALASLLTIAQGYYISQPVAPEDIISCGSTPAEAKALGCHFDLFSYAYYPDACYNKAQHDDFLSVHGPQINWTLPDFTPISEEEALEGIHVDLRPITDQFHNLHCTYEWQRLIRALAEERPLDRKLSRNVHSWHCSEKLLDKRKYLRDDKHKTTANILFGSCGLTAEEMHEFGSRDVYSEA